MSGEPSNFPSVAPQGKGAGRGALRTLRCVRHVEREAVGRCPACGGSFCRECVSEHEGRLLCSQCLSREMAAKAPAAKVRDWGRAKRALLTLSSLFVLWVFFFLLGELLVKIPTDFHEGKVWGAPGNTPP